MGPSIAHSYENVQHWKYISMPTQELLMMSVSFSLLCFCFHSSTQNKFPVGV